MNKSQITLLGALSCLMMVPAVGLGQPITIDFRGVVTFVDADLGSEFGVGETVVGRYVYDQSAPDINDDPNRGSYEISGFSATVGDDYFVTIGGASVINISNAATTPAGTFPPPPNFDVYAVDLFDPNAAPVAGNDLELFSLAFIDSTGAALPSDALPPVPPGLSLFASQQSLGAFGFSPTTANPDPVVAFRVTSLSVVPEPSAAVLLFIGFACSAARRRIGR